MQSSTWLAVAILTIILLVIAIGQCNVDKTSAISTVKSHGDQQEIYEQDTQFMDALDGFKSKSSDKSEPTITISTTNRLSLSERLRLATKLVNFGQFKETFRRNYGSIVEELARKRVFLARALRATISGIKYLGGQAANCLSINHFSDWTIEEIKQTWNKLSDWAPSIESPTLDDVQLELLLNESIKQHKQLNEALEMSKAVLGATLGPLERLEVVFLAPIERPITGNQPTDSDTQPSWRRPGLITRAASYLYPSLWSTTRASDAHSSNSKATQGGSSGQVEGPRDDNYDDDDGDEDEDETEEEFEDATSELLDGIFFDHRDSSCIAPIRDQKQCGSCYAFAIVSIAEWLYCKQTGTLINFSEQYLVDCGQRVGCKGCAGCSDLAPAEFVSNYGLELATSYKYLGTEHNCPKARTPLELADMGAKRAEEELGRVRMHLKQALVVPVCRFEEVLRLSPIQVSIRPELAFHEHGRGIYLGGPDCDASAPNVDPNQGHAVVLIGHGRENGHEYWLMRNSFGSDWGELGYFKLSKVSKCLRDQRGFIFGRLSEDGKRLEVLLSEQKL